MESKRGGKRDGAGRKPEGEKPKSRISATIDTDVWETALTKWGGKGSHLLEKLLRDYIK